MNFKQFLSGFFITLIVPIILALVVVGGSFHQFLYPSVYQNALEENGAYDLIEENFLVTSGTQFIKIPDEGTRVLVDGLITNLTSYIRGNDVSIVVEVDSSELTDFFYERAEEFPVCEDGKEPYENNKPVCRPPEKTSEEFLHEVLERENSTHIIEQQNVDLLEVYGGGENIEPLRKGVLFYRLGLLSLILIVFALGIVGFMRMKDPESRMMRNLAITFIWSGLGGLLILILDVESLLPVIPLEGLSGLLISLVNSLINHVIFISLAIAIAGVLMLIYYEVNKPKKKKSKKALKTTKTKSN